MCVCVCVCVCLCVYVCVIMKTFVIKTWKKINVEAINHNGKNWINEKDLGNVLGYKNLVSNKTQYYDDSVKKRRYDIKECEDFQPCRKFISEELAVHLIIDIKITKAGELKIKPGFKQHDSIMIKQQPIGERLRTIFSNEIIEDFSAVNYLIDFYFRKYKLTIEVDKLGHKDRKDQTEEIRRQKFENHYGCNFIIMDPDKANFNFYDGLGKI